MKRINKKKKSKAPSALATLEWLNRAIPDDRSS